MDAVEFNKEFSSFCSNHECSKCPITTSLNFACTIKSLGDNAESVVEIVEGWAKDHPVKTRKSEFLKLFPDAKMVNIERTFCVAYFEPTKECKANNPSDEQCIACRYRCWNEKIYV